MTGEITLTGIVLSSMPIGDYDRRVSILTCEKGRISAFARNARRPMSSLRAVSMPFTFGKFSIFSGRDAYSVNSCEDTVFFDSLSSDIGKMYHAMYFCELMSFFTRENSEEREQVKLLFTALKVLRDGKIPCSFARRIFELRCLANYGEAPNIFECSVCSKKEDSKKWLFDIKQGTIKCENCAGIKSTSSNNGINTLVIPETVRYAMHYTITSPYKTLFGFKLIPEMEERFTKAVDAIIKNHVDKPLKTLEILETLEYNQ
ncbi:MAG: DNA repair protein RecO [Lachnospiraceae bacterium]|nr:DNA repair protein RecO [Lachnospiraceae bacterium]